MGIGVLVVKLLSVCQINWQRLCSVSVPSPGWVIFWTCAWIHWLLFKGNFKPSWANYMLLECLRVGVDCEWVSSTLFFPFWVGIISMLYVLRHIVHQRLLVLVPETPCIACLRNFKDIRFNSSHLPGKPKSVPCMWSPRNWIIYNVYHYCY